MVSSVVPSLFTDFGSRDFWEYLFCQCRCSAKSPCMLFSRALNHISWTLKIRITLVSISKNFWFTYVVKMFESSTPPFSLFFFKLFLWQMWMLNLKLLEKFHLELYLLKCRFMYLNCWLIKLWYLWLKSDSLIW